MSVWERERETMFKAHTTEPGAGKTKGFLARVDITNFCVVDRQRQRERKSERKRERVSAYVREKERE